MNILINNNIIFNLINLFTAGFSLLDKRIRNLSLIIFSVTSGSIALFNIYQFKNFKNIIANGTSSQQKKEYANARIVFHKALKLKPKSFEALLGYSEVLYYQKNYKESLTYLDQARLLDPKNARVLLNQGLHLKQQKKYNEAFQILSKLLYDNPSSFLFLEITDIYIQTKQYNEAQKTLNELIKREPNHLDALRMTARILRLQENWEAAESKYEEGLKINDKDKGLRIGYIKTLMKQKDYPQAIENLKSFVLTDPTNSRLYYYFGLALYKAKNYHEAGEKLAQALYLKPSIAHLRTFGKALSMTDQEERAIEHLKKALEKNQKSIHTLSALAMALRKAGRYEEALEVIEKALKLKPESHKLKARKGRILIQKPENLAEGTLLIEQSYQACPQNQFIKRYYADSLLKNERFAEAQTVYSELYNFNPENIELICSYSDCVFFLGEHIRAEEILKVGLIDFPRSFKIHLCMIDLLIESNSIFLADKYFERALKIKNCLSTYVNYSNFLMNIGNYKKASEVCEMGLIFFPKDLDLLHHFAVSHFHQNNLNISIKACQEALEIEPNNYELMLQLGDGLRELEKYEEALSIYKKVKHLNPTNVKVEIGFGKLFFKWGKHNKADAHYRLYLQKYPDDYRLNELYADNLIKLKKFDAAIATYSKILNNVDQLKPDLVCKLADLYKKVGQFENAKIYYVEALRIDKNNISIRVKYLQTLSQLGDESLEEEINDFLAVEQNSFDGRFLYAQLLYKQKRMNEAVVQFEHALQIKPNDLNALNYCGHLYLQLNFPKKAVASFKRLVHLKPTHPEFKHILAVALRKNQQYEAANSIFLELLKQNSNNVELLWLVGESYYYLKNYDLAIDYFEQCFKINPGFKDLWFQYGGLLRQLNRYNEALEKLGTGLTFEGNKHNFYYHYFYADTLLLLNKDDEASTYLNQAASSLNKPWIIDFVFGKNYQRKKEYDQAENRFRNVILQDPYLGYASLASLQLEEGKNEEAIVNFLEAVKLNSCYICYFKMGVAYFNLGRMDEALKALQDSLGCHAHHKPTYVYLLEIMKNKGNKEKVASLEAQIAEMKDYNKNLFDLI